MAIADEGHPCQHHRPLRYLAGPWVFADGPYVGVCGLRWEADWTLHWPLMGRFCEVEANQCDCAGEHRGTSGSKQFPA